MREDGPKRALSATLVKVLLHHRSDRGMTLEPHRSRCVRRGEVHELVTTDHSDAGPGDRIDRVAFIGFAEFGCGGVLDRGDTVSIEGRVIGRVLGFDACHWPNHLNVLIAVERPVSGLDLALTPELEVRFAAGGAPAT